VFLRRFRQSRNVVEGDVQVGGDVLRPGITRSDEDFFDFRAPGEFPDDGVFTGAAADD
jgi:hypothetical protein